MNFNTFRFYRLRNWFKLTDFMTLHKESGCFSCFLCKSGRFYNLLEFNIIILKEGSLIMQLETLRSSTRWDITILFISPLPSSYFCSLYYSPNLLLSSHFPSSFTWSTCSTYQSIFHYPFQFSHPTSTAVNNKHSPTYITLIKLLTSLHFILFFTTTTPFKRPTIAPIPLNHHNQHPSINPWTHRHRVYRD